MTRVEVMMNGIKQIERSVEVDAEPSAVWRVLDDAAMLGDWAPPVTCVDRHAPREDVGAVRICQVEMNGRRGTMEERCVHRIEGRELAYVVDEESFGMRRMFDDYGFRIQIEPYEDRTRVRMQTFYTPRSALASTMNWLIMRRRFRGVVDGLLEGLRDYVEAQADRASDLG